MATRAMPGMRILVPAGERIAVDGRVVSGTTDIDEQLISLAKPKPKAKTLKDKDTTKDEILAILKVVKENLLTKKDKPTAKPGEAIAAVFGSTPSEVTMKFGDAK